MTIWGLGACFKAYFEWNYGGVLAVREIPPCYEPLCKSAHPLKNSVPKPDGLSWRSWERILFITCHERRIREFIGEKNWDFLRLTYLPVPAYAKIERFEALGAPHTKSGRSMKKRRLLEKILKFLEPTSNF